MTTHTAHPQLKPAPAEPIDRLARVEEGDGNRSAARQDFRATHHSDATRQILDTDESIFIHQSLSTPCLNVLSGCDGSYLIDAEGRKILDFHGNGVHAIGFAHPRVVAAVTRQLTELPFCTRRYTNQPAIKLAQTISSNLPDVDQSGGHGWRVLFTPAGSLAVGTAMKIARYVTGRYKAVGMWGSFHGSSLDTISIGGERMFRDRMGPLLPGTLHVHPWNPDRTVADALGEMERLFRAEGDIGAVVAEPIRWSTITIPPREYWQGVRELCDKHGALLIFDEIGTCMGRTGKWFGFEHYLTDSEAGKPTKPAMPDIVVMGKATGGGVLPLAAVAIQKHLVPPDATGDVALGHYTHEKSPLCCAAGQAAMDVIRDERLLMRAADFGAKTLQRMKDTFLPLPGVKAVRGLGMMFAVELESEDHAERTMYRCLRAGLSYKVSSGRVLTLVSPINIAEADMDFAIDTLRQTISAG